MSDSWSSRSSISRQNHSNLRNEGSENHQPPQRHHELLEEISLELEEFDPEKHSLSLASSSRRKRNNNHKNPKNPLSDFSSLHKDQTPSSLKNLKHSNKISQHFQSPSSRQKYNPPRVDTKSAKKAAQARLRTLTDPPKHHWNDPNLHRSLHVNTHMDSLNKSTILSQNHVNIIEESCDYEARDENHDEMTRDRQENDDRYEDDDEYSNDNQQIISKISREREHEQPSNHGFGEGYQDIHHRSNASVTRDHSLLVNSDPANPIRTPHSADISYLSNQSTEEDVHKFTEKNKKNFNKMKTKISAKNDKNKTSYQRRNGLPRLFQTLLEQAETAEGSGQDRSYVHVNGAGTGDASARRTRAGQGRTGSIRQATEWGRRKGPETQLVYIRYTLFLM